MTNTHLSQVFQSLKNVGDDAGEFSLGKGEVLADSILQVASVAKICDDVAVPL
jgi:hypothetical protein